MTTSVMPTYARTDVVFDHGEGVYLVAEDGKRYLDFGAGIAVASLGHAHPKLVAALTAQAGKLWHTSNLYRIPGQERLAERLCAHTFADLVFFANSGAEALEGCIKLSRRYFQSAGQTERTRIITFEGAFHGRTLGTLAASNNPKHVDGFAPIPTGFDHIAFGDLDLVRQTISDQTAAILIEPVQGEGGIRPATTDFLQGLRQICDAHGLLLIFDEVQTGVGRSGKLFAHEHAGVTPDVMGIAKGLGGGFPVGAFLATREAARGMQPGTHGSTFGGNPLAMAVGNAVLDEVLSDGFLDHVSEMAETFRNRLNQFVASYPGLFEEVRGLGLLMGLKCSSKLVNGDLVAALFDQGLLSVPAGDNVVRLIPPLVIGKEHIDEAMAALDTACASLVEKSA